MKKFVSFLICSLLLTISCNKHKYFDGEDHYYNDFESYKSFEEMLMNNKLYTQLTYDENYIEIDTVHPHTGNKCLKFFGKGTVNDKLCKCSFAAHKLAFWEDEIVRISCWYYIEGNDSLNWLFLLDLEERVAIGAGPGMRISIGSKNQLLLEHKYPNPEIYQTNAIDVPRNRWFNITFETKLSRKKEGWLRIYQDSKLIIEQNNWQTMPKDILYFQQGTKGIYNSVEFGITANPSDKDMILYLDDIEVSKILN